MMISRSKKCFLSQGKHRGFTLIEVVMAITILVVVVGIGYSSLAGIHRAQSTLRDRRDLQAIANALIVRLSREMQLAAANVALIPPNDDQDVTYSSRTNLLGTRGQLHDQHPGDSITFLALEGGQYIPDGGRHSGLVQITYRPAPPPQDDRENAHLHYLIREEIPYRLPFSEARKQAMVFPVTKRLVSLSFRYYDAEAQRWYEEWGGENEQKLLPSLIEFTLALESPRGIREYYTTAVAPQAS